MDLSKIEIELISSITVVVLSIIIATGCLLYMYKKVEKEAAEAETKAEKNDDGFRS